MWKSNRESGRVIRRENYKESSNESGERENVKRREKERERDKGERERRKERERERNKGGEIYRQTEKGQLRKCANLHYSLLSSFSN